MVKGFRKKTAIQGSSNRNSSAAHLGALLNSDDFASISAMFELEESLSEKFSCTTVDIVQRLAVCTSLAEQVLLIKENKSTLRSRLHIRCDAKLILFLYLSSVSILT